MSNNIFRKRLNEYLMVDDVNEADDDLQQPSGAGQGMTGGQPGPNAAPAGGMGGEQQAAGGGMDANGGMPGADTGEGMPGMNMGGGMPGGDAGGGMPGADMGGGMPGADMGGGTPGADMGGGMPGTEGGDGMGPDMGLDGLPDAQMDGEGIEDIEMEGGADTEQPGDEVIDVDQLTQSQEAAEYKIDGVDEKLTTLGAVVDKFIKALDQNNKKIEDLKAEFEKRNPTDEERINLRSQSSVPYMQTPKEYWDGVQERNPRYNVMTNNLVSPKDEQKEFELRKGDLASGNDRDIYDSFEYPTNLKDILDF